MRWIPLLPLIGSTFVAAQSITLPGAVVVQNSAYETGTRQYISDASIRAPMSKPAISDRSGKFVLEFSGVASGTPVRLAVSKPGFEVVNAREVQSVILGRIPSVEVVMVNTQRLAEAQEKFYRIATGAITASYHRKVAVLKQGNVTLEERLAAFSAEHEQEVGTLLDAIEMLTAERETAMENAGELARQLATTDLDNASDLFRQAFESLQRGEVEATLSLLSKERLDADYASAHADREKGGALIAQANEAIRQVYKSHGLKADVLVTTMDNAGALAVLDRMVTMLKTNSDAFTPDVEYDLAFRRGISLWHTARTADAVAEFSRGRDLVQEHLGKDHFEQVRFLQHWAQLLTQSDSLDQAISLLEEAFLLMRGHEEDEPLSVAGIEDALGRALTDKGDPVAAKPHILKGLELCRAHLPPNHPDVLWSMGTLANCHRALDEHKEELALDEEVYELGRSMGIQSNSNERLLNLGSAYLSSGDLEKAESTLRYARAGLIEDNGPSHPSVFLACCNLSKLLTLKGKLEEALAVLDSALAMNDGMVPEEHRFMGAMYHQRGHISYKAGDTEAALVDFEHALGIWKKLYGETHPYIASTRHDIANFKEILGDLEGALKEDSMAFVINERIFGSDDWHVWDAGCRVANRLADLGRDTTALNMFRRYLTPLKQHSGYGPTEGQMVIYEVALGEALYGQGEVDSACTVLERTIEIKATRTAEWYLHRIAMDQGREHDALEHVVKSARLVSAKTKDDDRKEVLKALRELATRLGRQDVLDEFKE